MQLARRGPDARTAQSPPRLHAVRSDPTALTPCFASGVRSNGGTEGIIATSATAGAPHVCGVARHPSTGCTTGRRWDTGSPRRTSRDCREPAADSPAHRTRAGASRCTDHAASSDPTRCDPPSKTRGARKSRTRHCPQEGPRGYGGNVRRPSHRGPGRTPTQPPTSQAARHPQPRPASRSCRACRAMGRPATPNRPPHAG